MGKRRLTLKELQQVELDILKSFHSFCLEHNLRYYMGGGTLIGAVRHKGFIPWDDDIDLMMPRPDYMKLVDLVKNDCMLDNIHKVDCCYFNPNSLSSAMRIFDVRTELTFDNFRIPYTLGCWIDVFPVDGLDSSIVKRKRHFRKMRIAMDLYLCSITKLGGKRRSKVLTILQYGIVPILPFIRLFKNHQYTAWLDSISRRNKYEDCDWVGVLEGRAVEKEAMLKSKMEPVVEVEFEKCKFWAMANYDEYLTNLYGNYMELPPEADRVSRHEISVYWKD